MEEGGIHTPNQLKKLESFIQMIRHKQDLLERLQQKYRKFSQLSENDFLWMSQLRYSLHQDTGEVSIKVKLTVMMYIQQWHHQPKKSGGSEQLFFAGEQ